MVVPVSRNRAEKLRCWTCILVCGWGKMMTHIFHGILYTESEQIPHGTFSGIPGVIYKFVVDITTCSTDYIPPVNGENIWKSISHCLTTRFTNYVIDTRQWHWEALQVSPKETSLAFYCRRLILVVSACGIEVCVNMYRSASRSILSRCRCVGARDQFILDSVPCSD